MVAPGQRVLVGVSGGPDSVGLLCILAALRRKLAIDLVAAHINHHLRGAASDADEQCAATVATNLGVPFVRADLTARLRDASNLESRARELRYRALHRLARNTDCARIATGHTRDDQAETVLLRLIRGSGIGGLSGIEPIRADGVIRPLLDCARREVEAYVRAVGQRYRIDESNMDQRFLRARVRHGVLPILAELNPLIVDHLARLARLSAAEKQIVQAWTTDQLGALQQDGRLDVERLRALSPNLHRHVVRAWLLDSGFRPARLTARHVDAVMRLALGSSVSGEVKLSDDVVARRYGLLQVGRGLTRGIATCVLRPGAVTTLEGGWRIAVDQIKPERKAMRSSADLWSAVCDADALADSLVVRPARAGERVRPLGLAGRHRKLSDVFIDRKVPAAERKHYPVVSYGEEILWVPGVIRSELLRVDEKTTVVLRLRACRR
jgi:tRNA(Ile)-lysidine synthase